MTTVEQSGYRDIWKSWLLAHSLASFTLQVNREKNNFLAQSELILWTLLTLKWPLPLSFSSTYMHMCAHITLVFLASRWMDKAYGQIQPSSTVIKHDRAGRKTSGPRLPLAFVGEFPLISSYRALLSLADQLVNRPCPLVGPAADDPG
jgi:hypothetical protein